MRDVVDTPDAVLFERVCAVVQRTRDQLAQCHLPKIEHPLKIRVVDSVSCEYYALYHRGIGEIEVAAPASLLGRCPPESPFAFLAPEEFFDSLIAHEMAHAALDGVPCASASCLVSHEYIAYASQVLSLPPRARDIFAERSGITRKVTLDALNMSIFLASPDHFAQRAWAHFQQQKDPCSFIGKIIDGEVNLDLERY